MTFAQRIAETSARLRALVLSRQTTCAAMVARCEVRP